MPEFHFELEQRVLYRASVKAKNRNATRKILFDTIEEGDGEALDIAEIDNTDFRITD
jgi:hypothetical protein